MRDMVELRKGLLLLLLVPFILASCARGFRWTVSAGKRQAPEEKVVQKREAGAEPRKDSRRQLGSGQAVRDKSEKYLQVARQYGEITGNSVNIRAGANMNYEIIGKFNKGDRVSILSSAFGWCEIELPGTCLGWIHKNYISTTGTPSKGKRVIGTVTGNSVRIRAKPGLRYTVLAKAYKGDKVTVVDLQGDWFGIEPTEDCTGWISSGFVIISSH